MSRADLSPKFPPLKSAVLGCRHARRDRFVSSVRPISSPPSRTARCSLIEAAPDRHAPSVVSPARRVPAAARGTASRSAFVVQPPDKAFGKRVLLRLTICDVVPADLSRFRLVDQRLGA